MMLWWLVTVMLIVMLDLSESCGPKAPDNSAMIAEQREARLQELKHWCYDNCVSQWEPWGHCNVNCGRGQKTRRRTAASHSMCNDIEGFNCAHGTDETAGCTVPCTYGGVPTGKGCQGCPRGRKGTCCEIETECDYPARPKYGSVDVPWPAKLGARAQFECDQGFNLQGDADTSQCIDSGSLTPPTGLWAPASIPVCDEVTCPPESVSASSQLEILNPKSTGYSYGEELYYDCKRGYKLRGSQTRECTKKSWKGAAPTCKAVECDDPGIPLNGYRNITGEISFKSTVTYGCETGYKLIGFKESRCLSSGNWLGHTPPACERVTCTEPFAPRNGEVRLVTTSTKQFAEFRCDEGYTLDGKRRIECGPDELWIGVEPRCKEISCGDPGAIDGGSKDGSRYTFPNTVSYRCHAGHELSGNPVLACQSNGQWNGTRPTCTACPMNTYEDDETGKCVSCPANSHTPAVGSINIRLCLCDEGYAGPAGGPCEIISCGALAAPSNGYINPCDDVVESTCMLGCNDGYFIQEGSATRTCQSNAEWDGSLTSCAPCPMNTYKGSDVACLACPDNSGTNAPAQMKQGCVCEAGYDGPAGGPCTDVDECLDDPCEDRCTNLNGTFICECTTPGYKVNPLNKTKCVVEQQCRNLTIDDAPEDGGFKCAWVRRQNSVYCSVTCNNGFEHPASVNNYETCGPTTDFIWTFETSLLPGADKTIPDCIPELFPGVRVEADGHYFAGICSELTPEQREEALQEFADRLNSKKVCDYRGEGVCEIKDMAIICGRTSKRRRRRGVEEVLHSVDFALNITQLQRTNITLPDCLTKICPKVGLKPTQCTLQRCHAVFIKRLKAAVLYGKRMMENVFKKPADMSFEVRGHHFEAEDVTMTPPLVNCEQGEVIQKEPDQDDPERGEIDAKCVPCSEGTFFNTETNDCELCPLGTYQNEKRQLTCIPCPEGTMARERGQSGCEVCKQGTFGPDCSQNCTCVNGDCNPFTGDCTCNSGWTGTNCDIDVDGCRSDPCYKGVVCEDIPAPATGFQCGICPGGLSGNGIVCM